MTKMSNPQLARIIRRKVDDPIEGEDVWEYGVEVYQKPWYYFGKMRWVNLPVISIYIKDDPFFDHYDNALVVYKAYAGKEANIVHTFSFINLTNKEL